MLGKQRLVAGRAKIEGQQGIQGVEVCWAERHRVWGAAELDRRAVGILRRNGWGLGSQELDQGTVRTPRSGGWRIRASARSEAQ